MAVVSLLALGAPLAATQPEVRITSEADLRFGSFVLMSAGSRTVSANGTVTDISIAPVSGNPVGPARFTAVYDRGNNGRKALDVVIQVTLLSVPPISQNGITGTLSAFDSDLPGALNLQPGRPVTITVNGCQTRLCGATFRIGGRLDITRSTGGGSVSVPLQMVATLVSVN